MNTHLLARRRARGWTQAELAGKAGISQPLVSLVEHGYRPAARSRRRISAALECSEAELGWLNNGGAAAAAP